MWLHPVVLLIICGLEPLGTYKKPLYLQKRFVQYYVVDVNKQILTNPSRIIMKYYILTVFQVDSVHGILSIRYV